MSHVSLNFFISPSFFSSISLLASLYLVKLSFSSSYLSSALLALVFSILGIEAQKPIKIEFEGGNLESSGVWSQLFSDEFNGDSLDTSTWYTYYPYGVGNSDICEFCRTHDK